MRFFLDSLTEDQVLQLISALCGPSSVPAQMHELIFERTKGHPLLTEQLLGYLSQMDPPEQRRAISDLKAVVDDDLPLTSLITNRIDALRPSEQLTLKVASILGEAFTTHLLHAVHPLRVAAPVLMRDIESLVANKFLNWADPGARETLRFVTGILRDVAYSLVPATQRARIHSAAAAVRLSRLRASRRRRRAPTLRQRCGPQVPRARTCPGCPFPQELRALRAGSATGKGSMSGREIVTAEVLADHYTRSLGFVDGTLPVRLRHAVELWEEAAREALSMGLHGDALAFLARAEDTAYSSPQLDVEFHQQWDARPSSDAALSSRRQTDASGKDQRGTDASGGMGGGGGFAVDTLREAAWSRIAAEAYLGLGDAGAAAEALLLGLQVLGVQVAVKWRGGALGRVLCCVGLGSPRYTVDISVRDGEEVEELLSDALEGTEVRGSLCRRAIMGPACCVPSERGPRA